MKPIERDRRRGGRSRYRTASTDRASRPIDLPQQMVGWDMVFQAEVVEQPLRRRLPPIIAGLLEYRSEKTESRSGSSLNLLYQRYRPKALDYRGCGLASGNQIFRLS